MTKQFQAYRMQLQNGQVKGHLTEMQWSDLSPHEIVIECHYSSVNYKDALGATGKGKIFKRFPINGGIDVAGLVVSSKSSKIKVGDSVLVTGCGIGETDDGGYAEYISVPESSVIPLPKGLSLKESMIIGTAGFTAALCLYRMQQNGQTPQSGPILVTGASGGVGSFATEILSQQGFEVWAVTGKKPAHDFLKMLGARRILEVNELDLGTRPLESVKFAGAIDNVGGSLLAGILRHTELWGNVASVGMAEGATFESTVMPFILRGVSLLGISSNNCPRPLRDEIWYRLAGLWKPRHLDLILCKTVGLKNLDDAFQELIERKITGRILVDIKDGAK